MQAIPSFTWSLAVWNSPKRHNRQTTICHHARAAHRRQASTCWTCHCGWNYHFHSNTTCGEEATPSGCPDGQHRSWPASAVLGRKCLRHSHVRADERHEFHTQVCILFKFSQHRSRDGHRILLLHTAHDHAEVARFDDDSQI